MRFKSEKQRRKAPEGLRHPGVAVVVCPNPGNDDRRVVKTRITPAGLALLKSLDQPVRELHKRQFRHMPAARLKTLAELLEDVRARSRTGVTAPRSPA